jgi:hypothetical protein
LRFANTVARTRPEIRQTSGPRSLLSNGGQLRAQIESRDRCLLADARRRSQGGFSGSAGYVHTRPRLRISGERLGRRPPIAADFELHFSEATSWYGDPQAGSGRGFDVMEISNPAKRGATP